MDTEITPISDQELTKVALRQEAAQWGKTLLALHIILLDECDR